MMSRNSTAVVLIFVTLAQTLVTMSAVVPSAISPVLAQSLGVRTDLIGCQIAIVYGAAMVTSSIGSATGAALVFTFAGVLAGPPAFTLLHGLIGSFTTTFGAMTALPAAGIFLLLLARRAER